MNKRISSIVIGVSYLAVGGYLGYVSSKFGILFADLYSHDVTLPALTRLMLALAPGGWIAFGIAAATFLIGKDSLPSLRKIPNSPFALLLLAISMVAVIALFLPLVVTIQEIGNT